MDALNTFINSCSIASTNFKEISVLQPFHYGLCSPINMGASRIEIQPRSFESLSYTSNYINMSEEFSNVQEKINQSSNAGGGTLGLGYGLWQAKAFGTLAKGACERLTQVHQSQKAEGVLVVNAMVTTRNVRCFTDISYDKTVLAEILSVMESGDKESKKRIGITDDNKLYILTEAVLGGSFTGLIIFLKQEDIRRDRINKGKEIGITAGIGGAVAYGPALGSLGYQHAFQSAEQAENDALNTIRNTNIKVEVFSQGSIPELTREVLDREIIRHLDLNPAKFEISQKDCNDAKDMVSGNPEARNLAICKRQMKIENAQVAIMNVCRGVTSFKGDKQTVHTTKTIMAAYDNFADRMISDSGCGIPIGFNYRVLTMDMIKAELEKDS